MYFSTNPTFDSETFRSRFRISREIFYKVFAAVTSYNEFFQQKHDCAEKLGISPCLRITTELRIPACGLSPDAMDDYLDISETTARDSLVRFWSAVIDTLGKEYLRKPNC